MLRGKWAGGKEARIWSPPFLFCQHLQEQTSTLAIASHPSGLGAWRERGVRSRTISRSSGTTLRLVSTEPGRCLKWNFSPVEVSSKPPWQRAEACPMSVCSQIYPLLYLLCISTGLVSWGLASWRHWMGNKKREEREEPGHIFPCHLISSGPSSCGCVVSEARLPWKSPTQSPDPFQWSQGMGCSNTAPHVVLQPKGIAASCSCPSLGHLSTPCLDLSSSVTHINHSPQQSPTTVNTGKCLCFPS